MSNVQPELIEQAKAKTPQTSQTSREQLRQFFIDALKSGEYKQVKRSLREPVIKKTFIEASMPSFLDLKKMFMKPTDPIPVPNYQLRCEYGHEYCAVGLAYEIMGGDWSHGSPFIYAKVRHQYGMMVSHVIQMNDDGVSFANIARALELGYFWDNTIPPMKFIPMESVMNGVLS